ncbi:MAG: nucleotide exchange factor GrpE [Magnetococcales bacterium]|nr:nucleotide exchange factor GrpE [Magnetococcales bacterium]
MTASMRDWRARIESAWKTLRKDPGQGDRNQGSVPVEPDPRNRIITLEMDLRDRDEEIVRLRQEYERLREQSERKQDAAVTSGLHNLMRHLAPLLSQLATMQALVEAGREMRTGDVLKLFSKVERVLAEAGMARIGFVGEETLFDSVSHQRLSGMDISNGDPVIIRFVGYRLGESVLAKAMISTREREIPLEKERAPSDGAEP